MDKFYSIKDIFKDKWLVIAIFFGLIIRMIYISEPVKYDEASSFLGYIESPNILRLFWYNTTNNHVFYNVITKIFYIIFGFSLPILRLVAFTSGVLSIPIIYYICKEFNQDGRFAAISLASFPLYIEYSTNARGYTLQTFILLLILLIIKKNYNLINNHKSNLIGLLIALATLTIPTFIFVIPGIFIWLFFINYRKNESIRSNFKFLKKLGSLFFKSFLFSFLLFLPIIILPGNLNNFRNLENLTSLGIFDFINLIIPYIFSTIRYYFSNNNNLLILFYLIIFLLGYFEYFKNKNKVGLYLLPSILLGIGLVFFTKLSFPESRTWLFLPSIFIITADNGFSLLISKLRIKFKFFVLLLVFSLLTVPLRSYTSANNPFNLDGDNGFPESNMVMKMIDKFREEKNLKNLNLYTNNSNAMSFHMQIWENNYPLKVCNTSVLKKNSFDAYKDDFMKLLGKNITNSNGDFEENSEYSYYVHLKKFNKINLGSLRYNSNELLDPDKFFISTLKGTKLIDNSIFILYRFLSNDFSRCSDTIPSQIPKGIGVHWSEKHKILNK